MSKIRNLEELREAIRDLEHQNYVSEQQLRKRVADIADSLKPMNLLRGLFSQVAGAASGVKGGLFRMAAGLVTSFVVKKFFKKSIAK
ncbi:MAG: hypothetical protein BGO55_32145 [Sphingobacteriales bacterium 50-39]|nr:hypothetical protein [Sphingobacteriales bacterium]OJW61142.1 MAG: hypothetical protein BGO55_32145 [Sphingobacteriales bacterium 50-39]